MLPSGLLTAYRIVREDFERISNRPILSKNLGYSQWFRKLADFGNYRGSFQTSPKTSPTCLLVECALLAGFESVQPADCGSRVIKSWSQVTTDVAIENIEVSLLNEPPYITLHYITLHYLHFDVCVYVSHVEMNLKVFLQVFAKRVQCSSLNLAPLFRRRFQ